VERGGLPGEFPGRRGGVLCGGISGASATPAFERGLMSALGRERPRKRNHGTVCKELRHSQPARRLVAHRVRHSCNRRGNTESGYGALCWIRAWMALLARSDVPRGWRPVHSSAAVATEGYGARRLCRLTGVGRGRTSRVRFAEWRQPAFFSASPPLPASGPRPGDPIYSAGPVLPETGR
jgi:hypothetical protein